jgi:pilus assembly protein CpaB
MNTKALVPLSLAVVLGLTAALMVRAAMSHKQAVVTNPGNLVTVAVAKLDADPGHVLTIDDLTTARLPADALPAGVFSDPAQLVGRVATATVVKGQTILETMLAPNGSAGGLAAVVPPGLRAVTLEVSEFSGVGGMLEPGCRVDILSVMGDAAKKGSVARTILQNIKVTACGRNIVPPRPVAGQPAPPPSNSVTLLVTPKQAQILQLASNTGRPCLVLRSSREKPDELSLDSTTLAELQGNPTDGADPIGEQPAVATDQTAQQPAIPTTNPTAATATAATPGDAAPAAIPAMIRRTVTVFNGDTESRVSVMVPNPRAMVIDSNVDGFATPAITPDAH